MKILYLTDIHHDSNPSNPHYLETNIVLPKFWDWLEEHKLEYDLIICGGDLVVRGPAEKEELYEFKSKMDSLKHPYIALPGNHDICPFKGMEERYPGLEEYEYTSLENTNFAQVFGEKGLRISFVANKVKIIGFALRDEDPDGQLNWLENELQGPIPKLVFGHYPVVKARIGGFCSTWDYNRIGKVRHRLSNILSNEKYKVKGYFCGHLHINSRVSLGQGYQIVTGALGVGLTTYKTIEIKKDLISVRTKRLPFIGGFLDSVYALSERSNDSLHTTVESYHWGNQEEGDFELYL